IIGYYCYEILLPIHSCRSRGTRKLNKNVKGISKTKAASKPQPFKELLYPECAPIVFNGLVELEDLIIPIAASKSLQFFVKGPDTPDILFNISHSGILLLHFHFVSDADMLRFLLLHHLLHRLLAFLENRLPCRLYLWELEGRRLFDEELGIGMRAEARSLDNDTIFAPMSSI
ncbi:hypothetical protein BS50DRAFT_246093, partial [Corynespora cassiicola Philippines]